MTKGMKMEKKDLTWYAVRTAGKFRQGQYYRNDQLGVLGRMAMKVGILVVAEPPKPRQAALQPAKKAVKPRKRAVATPVEAPDGEASV